MSKPGLGEMGKSNLHRAGDWNYILQNVTVARHMYPLVGIAQIYTLSLSLLSLNCCISGK